MAIKRRRLRLKAQRASPRGARAPDRDGLAIHRTGKASADAEVVRVVEPSDASESGDVSAAPILAAALAALARRDFASAELAERLTSRGHASAAVAAVIAELIATRSLDDARYAEHYVAAHARRGEGPLRIAQALQVRGIAAPMVQAALAGGPDWQALARSVRASRFGREPPADRPSQARQARFLQYRGFSTDHIRSALGRDLDP